MNSDPYSENDELNKYDAIAVIAMDGVFPGANNLEEFWDNLKHGRETVRYFTDEELSANGVTPELLENNKYVKARGVIDNIDLFDAAFFNYSPSEAAITDPQHRLFLELCWRTLEKAGYCADKYTGQVGVFAGCGLLNQQAAIENSSTGADFYQQVIAQGSNFLSTKVSYKLDLSGPSLNLNTACSTSLVAIATACKQLLSYECDMALAGGVTILTPQHEGYLYQEGGILSPDGHCRAFDVNAAGTVPSSGAGVVLLKRLDDALEYGDNIDAVILGAAVNNDGAQKIGFTAPSVLGQANCIAEALALAEVDLQSINYIETHGTGTVLGDPIEISALTRAFAAQTRAKQFCAIGSVKSNIGHTDCAAGVAGFIKTVLALKHKMLPPTINYQQPNPNLRLEQSPFYVNSELTAWKASGGHPRRAGVSSFGLGGTNAHVVLEEAPLRANHSQSRPLKILLLSAKNNSALNAAVTGLRNYLQQRDISNDEFADLAFTLQLGRKDFNCRHLLVCADVNEAVNKLSQQSVIEEKANNIATNFQPSLLFMFPGQGAQYINMGLGLYKTEPVFKQHLDYCCELLTPQINFDLRTILFPKPDTEEQAAKLLKSTQYTQPILFIIEYALAQLFLSWGIKPGAVIGHSIGEYAAATIAGVFSLEDALSLISYRGKLISQLSAGVMVAIGLPATELEPLLQDSGVSLAAINGPALSVVSGAADAIEAFVLQLHQHYSQGKINLSYLRTSHAFHSAMMEPILEDFAAKLTQVTISCPTIPYFSAMLGREVQPEELQSSEYWIKHIRNPVNFYAAMQNLLQQHYNIFLEIGPGSTLVTLAMQAAAYEKSIRCIYSLPAARLTTAEDLYTSRETYSALGQLWLNGINIDWPGFYQHESRRRIPLPTYPFQRQLCSLPRANNFAVRSTAVVKQQFASWFYAPSWVRKKYLINKTNFNDVINKYYWIIVKDNFGIADAVAVELKKYTANIITVVLTDGDYHSSEFYLTTIEKLQQNSLPIKIIHLASFDHGAALDGNLSIEDVREKQYFGFYSLLFLAQACYKYCHNIDIGLLVVTDSLHNVLGDERIAAAKAPLLAAVKVLPREEKNLHISCVDVEKDFNAADAGQLISEALEIPDTDTAKIIAYRNRYCWQQQLTPLELPHATANNIPLKNDGVYLITGGLGAIGLALAEYIANQVTAKIILLARTEFLSKTQWDSWLAEHDSADEVASKITILKNIEALGAQITLVTADVADVQQLAQVYSEILAAHSEINGVIHAAGIPGSGLALLKDVAAVEKIFAAKIYGTINLANLVRSPALDFFVMCSSFATWVGLPGQIDYSAANFFLDHFAFSDFFSSNTLVTTIDWNGWRDRGMSARSLALQPFKEVGAGNNISSEEGKAVFATALKLAAPQIIVSTFDPEQYIENLFSFDFFAENNEDDTVAAEIAKDYASVAAILQKLFVELLGVSEVDLDADFFALGGHSLLALNLLTRINKLFAIKIPLAQLYEMRTINQLAEIIAAPEANANMNSFMVNIVDSGDKSPIFFNHPVGGTSFCYLPLGKELTNGRPLYATQDPGLQDPAINFADLIAVASAYLEKIRELQPHGPYILGGASYGGTLAYEMARQLLEQGETVEKIILIDSWALFSNLLRDKTVFNARLEKQQELLKEQLIFDNLPITQQQWLDMQWNRMQLLLDYRPVTKLDVKIILFKAQDLLPEYQEIDEPNNHWQQYSSQPITTHIIPGNHMTMLMQPNVKFIAEKM